MHANAHPGQLEHDAGRAFVAGISLNVAFVVVEVIAGIAGDSVALLSDGLHNVGDVLGLLLAAVSARLAKRHATVQRTYGLRRLTILAALANAVIILGGVAVIVVEALLHLSDGARARGTPMIVVAAIGVAVNGGSALLFAKGRERDVNVRGAFLHLASDALVSLAVVVAGILVAVLGWTWIDPVLALIVAAVVVVGSWPLLRDATNLALDAVPKNVDVRAVEDYLASRDGVAAVHDLHVWPLSTTETALTAHLVAEREISANELHDLAEALASDHSVHHSTIQVERRDSTAQRESPRSGCEKCPRA